MSVLEPTLNNYIKRYFLFSLVLFNMISRSREFAREVRLSIRELENHVVHGRHSLEQIDHSIRVVDCAINEFKQYPPATAEQQLSQMIVLFCLTEQRIELGKLQDCIYKNILAIEARINKLKDILE